MREKGKHILAYDYYFITGGFISKKSKKEATKGMIRGSNFYNYFRSLCGRRSLLQVARKFGVSRTAVYKWYGVFNWKERVKERDQEINRKLMEKLQ